MTDNFKLSFFDLAQKNNTDGDLFEEYLTLKKKTIKGDDNIINHIIFNGLSSYAEKQYHLIIAGDSSEGKTWPLLQTTHDFPRKNLIILESGTPQIFKYEFGVLVDSNYRPLTPQLNEIEDKIKEIKINIKENANEIKDVKKNNELKNKDKVIEISIESENLVKKLEKLEIKQKSLLKNSLVLVDLRNKWIVFKEPPHPKLLEALYSTLSADEEFSKQKFVDRTKNGNRTFSVVFRGTPAMTLCSAKDETKNARWNETLTRFNIVSPTKSEDKYREGMQLLAQRNGLPQQLYEEHVLSRNEEIRQKVLVSKMIGMIRRHKGEVFNPFHEKLSKQFPNDGGYRWRQFQRFNTLLNLHTLVYSHKRPYLALDRRIRVPVVTKADVIWTANFMKDSEVIPPHKIRWFEDVFLNAYEDYKKEVNLSFTEPDYKEVIIGSEIVEYLKDEGQKVKSTKQIRETYLETLYHHGLIEKQLDPRNRTREVYWPTELYDKNEDSSLIAVSSLDESCVKSCLDKYLQRRFYFTFKGQVYNQDEIIDLIMSEDNLLSTSQIVVSNPKNVPKNTNDETTSNDDLTKNQ